MRYLTLIITFLAFVALSSAGHPGYGCRCKEVGIWCGSRQQDGKLTGLFCEKGGVWGCMQNDIGGPPSGPYNDDCVARGLRCIKVGSYGPDKCG